MKVFLFFTLILATPLWARTCGLEGSIDKRIQDCHVTKGNFSLVTVNEKGHEIYKDLKTNLLWGDRIPTDFNHYGSSMACSSDIAETNLLPGTKWRLPTINEFETAASHGIKNALPRMDRAFWSSTSMKIRSKRLRKRIPARAYLWDGLEERTDSGDLKDAASVRCVSRLPDAG